jgi:cell division protein FtsB
MSIQDVLQQLLETQQRQLAAYQQDVTNLLALIQNLNDQVVEVTAWLAANPA